MRTKSAEIAVLIFSEINNNEPSFSLDLPEAHLSVKYLIWSVLQEYSTAEYRELNLQKLHLRFYWVLNTFLII